MGMGEFLQALSSPDYFLQNRIRAQKDSEQRNLDDIMASGYTHPTGKSEDVRLTEGRGTFGQLLQGVGLIGAPEPRAFTPYEQFLYEQGQHYKSNQDMQTERERQVNLARQLNTAQDYVNTEGQLPPDEFMQGLPEGTMSGLENQLVERIKGGVKKEAMQGMQLQGMQSLVKRREQLTNQGKGGEEDKASKAFYSSPPLRLLVDQYKHIMTMAAKPETPTGQKNELLYQAQQIVQRMAALARSQGQPTEPFDQLGQDFMSPYNKEPEEGRIVQDPTNTVDALKMLGVYGGTGQ